MTPAYISGPFAGDAAENTKRAVALCLWATRQGYAPICVHPGVLAGAYGDDGAPEDRARGLDVCVSLVSLVAAHLCGVMLVILRDDGTMSGGTAREVAAWKRFRGNDHAVDARTWAEWVALGVSP